MRIDAHYYAVLAFALQCGFKKESAKTLAYASQYVDDAKINQLTIDGSTYAVKLDCQTSKSLLNMATCHSYSHLKTFNLAAMINNTCAFHFVPGCEGDKFAWKMTCKPGGPVLQEIKDRAIAEDDLVKLGIVLHAWADSYSHQGFSGLLSKPNDIKELRADSKVYLSKGIYTSTLIVWFRRDILKRNFDNIFDRLVPPYGHAQALHYPDEPYIKKWFYKYDENDIFYKGHKIPVRNNIEIYGKAFESITSILKQYLEKHPVHKEKNFSYLTPSTELYDILFLRKNVEKREKKWIKKLLQMEPFKGSNEKDIKYDDKLWLSEAFANYETDPDIFTEKGKLSTHREVRRIVQGARLKPTFPDSNWHRYHLAVRWYKEQFHELCHKNQLPFDHQPYYPKK